MAIPLTQLHGDRIIGQIRDNLVGLQRDMVQNATTHKTMAQAQSPARAVLATFVTDASASYLTRLQWVIDLRDDATRRARLLTVLARVGIDEQDIIDMVTPLRAQAIALRDASKATYALIIVACDTLLAAVDPPESLWPE